MTKSVSKLFQLLGTTIGGKPVDTDLSFLSADEWKQLIDISFEQGVGAISVDGYHRWLDQKNENTALVTVGLVKGLKFGWFSSVFQSETAYQTQLDALVSLARFYSENSIKMLLLKGYGLSLYYPHPSHRGCGDIDLYLYGNGGEADRLIQEKLGCKIKQNEDKHSTFQWQGVLVENHACFINYTIHPYLRGLEAFFEQDAENAVSHTIPESNVTICLPSVMTNALFLPFHIAGHFVHGEASLRQLCDWACFLNRYGRDIDWVAVEQMSKEYGFYSFYCCLNGIVKEHLGVSQENLPDWPHNIEREELVLNEILHPKYAGKRLLLLGKVRRYVANGWKYKMVYKDSMLLSSFKLAKSYIRLHDKNAKSIWEIKRYV